MTINNKNVKVTEILESPPEIRQSWRHTVSTMSRVAEILKRNINEWVRVLELPHKARKGREPDRHYAYNRYSTFNTQMRHYFSNLGYQLESSPVHDWENRVTIVYMKISETLVKQGNPEGEQSL